MTKLEKITIDLLKKSLDFARYKNGGPKEDTKYKTLTESYSEYVKGVNIEFDDYDGTFQYEPITDEIPFYFYNLLIPRKFTTFVYNSQRRGIVHGDYKITNYISKDGKLIKLSDREIAELMLNEIMENNKDV